MALKKFFVLLLTSLTFVYSAAANAENRAEIAWQLIDRGAFLVDVRTPQEFDAKHLDGAVNFPLQVVDRAFQNIPKDTPIVVYCRSGNRSGQALQYLLQNGYKYVFNGGGLQELLMVKAK